MKSIQRIAAAVAILCAVTAAQSIYAQTAGGWTVISVRDEGVVQAARFAVAEHGKQERITLRRINRARRQVVAGSNYELTLLVKRGKKNRKAVAMVWQKVDGSYEMTSWKWR